MAFIGVSHALYLNRSVWINLSRSPYGFGLGWLVTTDSVGTRSANCVISFILSPFDKQFATHRVSPPGVMIQDRVPTGP